MISGTGVHGWRTAGPPGLSLLVQLAARRPAVVREPRQRRRVARRRHDQRHHPVHARPRGSAAAGRPAAGPRAPTSAARCSPTAGAWPGPARSPRTATRSPARCSTISSGENQSRLSSSAKRAARRHVRLGPLPPTRIGIRGAWSPRGTLIASRHRGHRARVGRPAAGQHPGRDLERVLEQRHPLPERREAEPVGDELVLLPAGPEAQLRPAAGDDVERRDHLGDQRRVAVPGAQRRGGPGAPARSPRPAP